MSIIDDATARFIIVTGMGLDDTPKYPLPGGGVPFLHSRVFDGSAFFFPENGLHPFYQIEKIRAIVEKWSKPDSKNVLILTHSIHVLVELNNMLKAGMLAKKGTERRRISRVVPRKHWISPSDLVAFEVNQSGEIKNIMRHGLIDAKSIDAVGDTLYRRFDKLLELEVNHGK